MLTAVKQGRLTLARLIELMATNPRRIFGLPEQPDTFIEVDPEAEYIITNEQMQTKCGWTPFAGLTLTGRVERVTLRGTLVYDAAREGLREKIVAQPGSGRVLP